MIAKGKQMKDDRENAPKPDKEEKSNDSGDQANEPEDNQPIGGPTDHGASDPPAGNTMLSDF
jgi:hypothetical protein